MLSSFILAICLQAVPYGNNRDLVPNQLIKDTKISTGLFYSMHMPGQNEKLVGLRQMSLNSERVNVLAGVSGKVSSSNYVAFHPAFVGFNVKLFHMDLNKPIVLDGSHGNLMAKSSTVNYHLIKSNQASRVSRADKASLLKHCEDSTFKLVENNYNNNRYYELLSHDLNKATTYDSGDRTLKFKSTRSPSLLKFSPERYELKPTITEFRYNEFVYSNLKNLAVEVPSAQAWNFTNESYEQTDSHHVTINERVENTAEFSFSKSSQRSELTELGVNVGVSASFLGFGGSAGASTTTTWGTMDQSLSETRTVKIDETSFSLTSDILVAPRHGTEFVLIWHKVDLEIGFVATVKMTAVADRLNMDGSVSRMVPVDPEGVLALLHDSGFRGNVSIVGSEVVNHISGTVHVKGATRGQTRRRDWTL